MRSLLLSLQRFCILSLTHDSTPLSASLNLTFSLSLQLSSSAALDMGIRSSFLLAPSPENASLPPPFVKMGKRRDSAAVFSLRISSLRRERLHPRHRPHGFNICRQLKFSSSSTSATAFRTSYDLAFNPNSAPASTTSTSAATTLQLSIGLNQNPR